MAKPSEIAKDQAKSAAVSKVTSKAPIAGVDDLLSNPKSVKTWAKVGVRSTIAYFVTPVVEDVINRIGYKRILKVGIGLVIVALCTSLMVGTLMVASIGAASQAPQLVAKNMLTSMSDSIKDFFGAGDSDSSSGGIADMCVIPVQPTLTTSRTAASTTTAVAASSSSAATPDSGGKPIAVYTNKGQATKEVNSILTKIPKDADAKTVQAYLLYAPAHYDGPTTKTWSSWLTAYRQQEGNDAMAIVRNMDSSGNYKPYILFSYSITLLGIEKGKFVDNDGLKNSLPSDVMAACQGGGVSSRARISSQEQTTSSSSPSSASTTKSDPSVTKPASPSASWNVTTNPPTPTTTEPPR